MNLKAVSAAVSTVVCCLLLAGLTEGAGKRVCYATNWSQYRTGKAKFTMANIDANLCTHVIYAFAGLNGNKIVTTEWNDDGANGGYAQLNALKNKNKSLKTLIAVGGWNLGMAKPSAMMATAATRKTFIDSSIAFCRQRKFDGLDLDFEFPGAADRGSPAGDKTKFTALVHELRAAFNKEGKSTKRAALLLSAAVSSGKNIIDHGYEIKKISADLDFVNLMSYDFHGSYDKMTGLNAPLYKRKAEGNTDRATFNVDYAASHWVAGGCPKQKLIIGMGTYGQSFTLTSAAKHGLGSPTSGAGVAGTYTKAPGTLAYYEICEMLKKPKVVTVLDNEQKAPYTYLGNQWVGYDNVKSLTTKVQYLKQKGYGGWMTWTLDNDDFTGSFCGAGTFPLHKALKKALG